MSDAVGVDVGGTKLAAARVDTGTGAVLEARRVPTLPARGPAAVLADCVALADALGQGPRGLAVCELVDPAGRVRSAETVDWRGADLSAFDRVESDVRAAALAEARFGAGGRDFLYVSVGTGISHCLIGTARRGSASAAARSGPARRWSSSGPAGSRSRAAAATRARRRRSPTRPARSWSRTRRGGSGSRSPRSSTRSTRAPW